jgi:hypothetical protein
VQSFASRQHLLIKNIYYDEYFPQKKKIIIAKQKKNYKITMFLLHFQQASSEDIKGFY